VASRPICEGHQFRRPSRITVAGTSSVRTRNVSIRIPAARPSPIARTWLASVPELASVSTMNVPPRIRPFSFLFIIVLLLLVFRAPLDCHHEPERHHEPRKRTTPRASV
jgi:hypothetical protein